MDAMLKYKLDLNETLISLPVDAQLRAVAEQNGEGFLWAQVDPTSKNFRTRRVVGFVTSGVARIGHEMSYIGTIFFKSGFVLHIYEDKNYVEGQ